jgi:hypothetical protein
MQFLVLVLMLIVVTSEYLEKMHLLPHGASYIQEVLSGCIFLYVVVAGVRNRFRYVRPAYWFVFVFIVFIMACGAIINVVEPGTVFAGLRNYMRAMPLFFLPLVYPFTDAQVRKQLNFLLALCLLQLPIAAWQRIATAARGSFTGDYTSGTLLISSILSIFLICAACVLTGLYLRKRLSLPKYLLLLCLIVAPTTINETKGTLILLPIGLLIIFILGSPRKARLKNAMLAVATLAVMLSGFAAVYDYLNRDKPYSVGIFDFFQGGMVNKYLDKKAAGLGSDPKEVGRVNAFAITTAYLADNPVRFAFGVGMGNASRSSLGPGFEGKYAQLFYPYLFLSVVRIDVELGFLGLLSLLSFLYLIYRDTKFVAEHDDGAIGVVAVGWLGVMGVITLALFYKDVVLATAIPFLFWYFSGHMAARRQKLLWGEA